MKKLPLFLILLACAVGCRNPIKPEVRVVLQPGQAALPFIAASVNKKSKVIWRLEFASDEEILRMIAGNDKDLTAAETDPVSLMHLRNSGVKVLALWGLQSPYGIVAAKNVSDEEVFAGEVGVAENEMSNILIDLWLGADTPVLKNIYDTSVRAKFLEEGALAAAVLNEPYLSELKSEGYRVITDSRDEDLLLNVLVFLEEPDNELFNKMLYDYRQGLVLYNEHSEYYNELYTSLTGRRIADVSLINKYFYDVGLFAKLSYFLKQRQPLVEIKNYDELFWLPAPDSDEE
jgi:hypothetical protein